MSRMYSLLLGAILLVVLVSGCGSKKGSAPETNHIDPADRFSQAITDVNSAPQPDGVETAVWGELQAELARVLKARRDGTLRVTSDLEPVVDLRLAGGKLCWTQRLVGDYDNNGLVGVGDLTPLGILYGKSVPASVNEQSVYIRVDGDGNGLVTAADITPLGVHYGETIIGYAVMRSESESGHGATEVAYIEKPSAGGSLDDTATYSYEPTAPGFYSVVPRGAGQTSAARSAFVANGNGGSGTVEVPPPYNSPDARPGTGEIAGRMVNQFGDPVDQGIIRVPGVGSVRTNEDGYFTIPGVGATTAQSMTASGENVTTSHDVTFVDGQCSRYVDLTVLEREYVTSLDNSIGGMVVSPYSETSISIEPDSFVDSNGDPVLGPVTVSITPVNVADATELQAAPASFNAMETDGTSSMLESYSMVEFSAFDDFGNPVGLASGAQSVMALPVPSEIRDYAPPTIGMYVYDGGSEVWRATGTDATLNTNRSAYMTDVGTTGWHNCDLPLYVRDPDPNATPTWAYLQIQVVDQHDNPIRGAFVHGMGLDYLCLPRAVTDDNGIATVEVNPQSQIRIWAEYDGIYESLEMDITTPAMGDTDRISLPIKIGGMSKFCCELSWSEKPSDLDLRLVLPNGNVCGYQNMDVDGARLITDTTIGFGPELIRVTDVMDGLYDVYVVKCPSVYDGPFWKSAARVSIKGYAVDLSEYAIPPLNPNMYNVWHVCRIQVSDSGENIFVYGVNQYVLSY